MGFTIYRSSGQFALGGWQEGTPVQITVTDGCVLPISSKDIQQLPEADRITESMAFYAKQILYVTRNDASNPGTSDQIVYQGVRYRIARVMNYMAFGYCKAIGVRMSGD